jgi:hypothetical protein
MNHRFDVFLNNDPAHPAGSFQTISYALNGQFTPASDRSFFRMTDRFTSGWIGATVPERAWWTGAVDVRVSPDNATDQRLVWQASHPESANSETEYSSGEEFSIGFVGASPDGGLGINASASFSNSKSHSIPDWGVANLTAGNHLRWTFTARQPCDPLNDAFLTCFEGVFSAPGVFGLQPRLPNELSRGQLQINASGRWRTNGLIDAAVRPRFAVATPVMLFDTFCGAKFVGWCAGSAVGFRQAFIGPAPDSVDINADWVNPIPIEALRLSANPANGAKNEAVKGTVVLARPASIPVSVTILSNNGNAVVGAPLPNVSGGSQRTLTIDPGESKGTFTVTTNDNGLSSGQHTTANISAFYTEATTRQLRIESR